MNEVIEVLQQGSDAAFRNQVLVILGVYIIGFLLIHLLKDGINDRWEALLAYPVGLAFYALSGYTLLLIGVEFCVRNVVLLIALVLLVILLIKRKRGIKIEAFDLKSLLASCFAVVILAMVFTSGDFAVAVSNDSVYYYSTYPSILTSEGFYVSSLDSFLSNVGQTTAIVNCLPFLFGFDETFGIQWVLNVFFLLIFLEACRETAVRIGVKPKYAKIAAGIAVLVLATSEPFLGTAVWILSNAYFMEYFFLVFYLAVKMAEEGNSIDYLIIQAVLIGMVSMLRMEGGVMVTILAVLISVYPASKKKLLLVYCLPLFLTVAGYYMMFFGRMGIDPLYSFLDWKKAAMMIAMVVALVVYIVLIRPFIPKDYIPDLLLAVLLLGNAGICVISRERYLTDIKAFILNIRQGNGWGIFGVVIGVLFILIAADFVRNKGKLSCISAVVPVVMLSVIAVCWARGGVLAVRMSDSGNRVMMQIAPLVIFALYTYAIRFCMHPDKEAK